MHPPFPLHRFKIVRSDPGAWAAVPRYPVTDAMAAQHCQHSVEAPSFEDLAVLCAAERIKATLARPDSLPPQEDLR